MFGAVAGVGFNGTDGATYPPPLSSSSYKDFAVTSFPADAVLPPNICCARVGAAAAVNAAVAPGFSTTAFAADLPSIPANIDDTEPPGGGVGAAGFAAAPPGGSSFLYVAAK